MAGPLTGSAAIRSNTGCAAASNAETASGPASTTLPPSAHQAAAASASVGCSAMAWSRTASAASRTAVCWADESLSNAVAFAASTWYLGKNVTSPVNVGVPGSEAP